MTATKRRYRQYVTCWGCRRPDQRHEGHGLCRACHVRWDAAGRPESGPPAPMPPQVSGRLGASRLIETRADRLQEYVHIGAGVLPTAVAAERLGVSPRTVARDRRELARRPLQLRIPSGRELEEAS